MNPEMSGPETFEEFRKIARLNRDCVITEKIDGTNAQISIGLNGEFYVGSRSRWLSEKEDNHGFYKWAIEHKESLLQLGPGRHYGEWWGSGIQRGYGLPKGEKRFSLFNTSIWNDETKPACCHVVPTLYKGLFNTMSTATAVSDLRARGSSASQSFMDPEGIVVYHVHANQYFKVTLKNDEVPKSMVKT